MAIRDKKRANAQPFLQPGETVQAVFGAQTKSMWFAALSIWIIVLANAYRVVVVTDRRILVCQSGRMTTTPIKEILFELPRGTRIGPASGLWYKCETLGEPLYIAKRFHKDVEAADALAGAAPMVPAASSGAAATWAPDPAGRNELRYWDGTAWTADVSNGGVQSVDPI
jgi:hypothetical protein